MISQYITLWDLMKRFKPEHFVALSSELGHGEGFLHGVVRAAYHLNLPEAQSDLERVFMPPDIREKVTYWPIVEKYLQESGLTMCALTAHKISTLVAGPGEVNLAEFRLLFQELSSRLADEMTSFLYYSIEASDKHLIDTPNLFGEEVDANFPKARFDIEEAGKCLAFERGTACVFHLMRVMEVGLHALGESLKLPPSSNRSWERILEKGDAELRKQVKDRSPEWAVNDVFFSTAVANLRSVKDAWRNPTMHVEGTYTEGQSLDIWNAVGGFMRHLATKLHG